MNKKLDQSSLKASIESQWLKSIVPQLCDYVRIPNKSPLFDPEWEQHGHMEAAIQLLARWCREQPIAGMTVDIRRIPGRTPLLFIDIPGQIDDCVLLYGHLDKQPEFTGWNEGLGPWEPVIRDGRLYGRGAQDMKAGLAALGYFTGAAAGTTFTRCLLPGRRSPPSMHSEFRARAVWFSSRRARKAAAPTCHFMSMLSHHASARRASSCVSMPSAATTSSSGARRRCAGIWWEPCR